MELISQFENRIAIAQMNGEEWVETDPKIIDTIMRMKPWKSPGYIIYKGIKVCPYGKSQEIENHESISVDSHLYQPDKKLDE